MTNATRAALLAAIERGGEVVETRSHQVVTYAPRKDNDHRPWVVREPGVGQSFRVGDAEVSVAGAGLTSASAFEDAQAKARGAHVPGHDPLPALRLEEIRAHADTPEIREVLGELDRVHALLDRALEDNGTLLDNWARYEGVTPNTFLGVLCRTCHAEIQPGTEGCPRHSPTVIGRALYRMHAENRSLLDEEEAGNQAVAMLDAALPLLAGVLNPVDHKEGCRPH
ncbi:hypothetical protein, partial [Streptomyces sp. SP18BB07]|uniref:hypothetical protein n=1 Tax=Streptomyces sp. SP18BB07 TaxID=3002522 RepID=UPI002E780F26